jgi:hypothetical protein
MTPWTGDQPDTRPLSTQDNINTDIHDSSGIQTHDRSVRAGEDALSLTKFYVVLQKEKNVLHVYTEKFLVSLIKCISCGGTTCYCALLSRILSSQSRRRSSGKGRHHTRKTCPPVIQLNKVLPTTYAAFFRGRVLAYVSSEGFS